MTYAAQRLRGKWDFDINRVNEQTVLSDTWIHCDTIRKSAVRNWPESVLVLERQYVVFFSKLSVDILIRTTKHRYLSLSYAMSLSFQNSHFPNMTHQSLNDQRQQDQPQSRKEFIEALQEWIRLRLEIIRQLEKIIRELENAKNKTNIAELSASVLGLLSVGVQISRKWNDSSISEWVKKVVS